MPKYSEDFQSFDIHYFKNSLIFSFYLNFWLRLVSFQRIPLTFHVCGLGSSHFRGFQERFSGASFLMECFREFIQKSPRNVFIFGSTLEFRHPHFHGVKVTSYCIFNPVKEEVSGGSIWRKYPLSGGCIWRMYTDQWNSFDHVNELR